MKFTITNPWLSVDRAYEDDEAYLDSVHYLAETAYDEIIEQIKDIFEAGSKATAEDKESGGLFTTTVGNIWVSFDEVITNFETIEFDDVTVINEDKLWEIVYEATEAYIKRGEDV